MDEHHSGAPHSERSDSSASSSLDHREHHEHHEQHPSIHAPVPFRPRLPSRKSSGTIIVPRDYIEVGPLDRKTDPDDVRSMSPRRTEEDLVNLGKEAREELRR